LPLVLALLVVPFILTKFIGSRIAELLFSGGAVRENYLGERIPTAAGISIVISSSVGLILAAMLYKPLQFQMLLVLSTFIGMAILGLLDDLIGSREVTGLKGHLLLLLKEGRLTTGSLKALGGGFLALVFSSFFSNNLGELLLNTGLIALFANAVNLTDLRPGRAGKVFLIIGVLLLVYAFSRGAVLPAVFIITPVLGATAAFLPYDLSGEMMLGDTGSNSLGIVLGMTSVLLLSSGLRILVFLLLVLLHLYTEKYSLTETIERIGFLRYLDEWGRP